MTGVYGCTCAAGHARQHGCVSVTYAVCGATPVDRWLPHLTSSLRPDRWSHWNHWSIVNVGCDTNAMLANLCVVCVVLQVEAAEDADKDDEDQEDGAGGDTMQAFPGLGLLPRTKALVDDIY